MILSMIAPIQPDNTPFSHSLPNEILQLICRQLKELRLSRTLSNFQSVSRSLYDISTPILYNTIRFDSVDSTVKFFGVFDLISIDDLHLACQSAKKIPNCHPIDMPLPLRLRHNARYVRKMLVNEVPNIDGLATRYEKVRGALDNLHEEAVFPSLLSLSLGLDAVKNLFDLDNGPQWSMPLGDLFHIPSIRHVCLHLGDEASPADWAVDLHKQTLTIVFSPMSGSLSTITYHHVTSQDVPAIQRYQGQAQARVGFANTITDDDHFASASSESDSLDARGRQIIRSFFLARDTADKYPDAKMTVFRPSANLIDDDTSFTEQTSCKKNTKSFRRRLVKNMREKYRTQTVYREHQESPAVLLGRIKLLSDEEADMEPPCIVCGGKYLCQFR